MSSRTSIAALLLAGATLLTGCGAGEAGVAADREAAPATAVPVEVVLPERGDIYAHYVATATIASDRDAAVVARAGGEVVELLVEEGDSVAPGQVLARLDGARLRLEMLATRASLDQMRGEYERYVDLHRRGLVSASMFDGLKYDLEALEASYRLKRLSYEYSTIRAPIGGVVSAREVKPGQHLAVNDVAFRVTDTRELIAHLRIPQSELAKFAVGHSASLTVDAMPERAFDARIVRISPTIDTSNGTFRATVSIDNAAGDLAPGMFARFTIAYEQHDDVLLIPGEALVAEDGETVVYVVADGAVARRHVETGISAGGRVEIVDGLSIDDAVVVVGQSGLRDGSKVVASIEDSGADSGEDSRKDAGNSDRHIG